MRLLVAAVLSLLATGCATIDYLAQAGAGQDEIFTKSRDVDELVKDHRLAPRERRLIVEVAAIKRYGEAHGLVATKSYTRYARLDRDAAVWVVSACEPLRFRSKTWWFPIVGSITYTGWFRRDAADREAAELAKQGWDIDVRPAGAYSTLGWLDDPLLSTMIDPGDDARGELANTVLHESTHTTFYVPGQSRLNESVASFVGDALTASYLREMLGEDAKETRAYEEAEARRAAREAVLREAYLELQAVYASKRSDAEKRVEKARVLSRTKEATNAKRPISNATLVQFATYHSGEAELARLFETCGKDVRRMLATLRRIQGRAHADQEEDVGQLVRPMLGEACGG
jgi:predicted aminopeptidase